MTHIDKFMQEQLAQDKLFSLNSTGNRILSIQLRNHVRVGSMAFSIQKCNDMICISH